MERIVLEVKDDTAKKWRAASSQLRSRLSSYINEQLNKVLNQSSEADSMRFFDELRVEMEEKGLTQEILDEIINED